MRRSLFDNHTPRSICLNALIAALSLFLNGFGTYLTIRAGIGAGPWDVFNLGLSKTFGILYGTASISVSLAILLVDIVLREPIGIAMFIDAVVVGKSVDLFNALDWIPAPEHLWISIPMMLIGLTIMGYTQFLYMRAALGCGPRDTLLVGLSRHSRRVPIGVISIAILSMATLAGYLLGGPVGIGTLICAFCAGPIMQLAFTSVRFDATTVTHQKIPETIRVFRSAL